MADVEKLMRLLRPIYDAIDARAYKNAIKMCSQKKICEIDLVQVLQAHCLERIGKVDEALRIVRRVQLKKPTDENLLNTMQLVFKLCGVPEEMLQTYEHAVSLQPTNQEMNCQLFYGYSKVLALAKQQQHGFKMYKTFNSLQYVGWACLSMLLQVTVEKSLPVKMLPLADKMLTKALRDHPKDSNGEFTQLLVLLLQAQDKPQEAMAAFQEFIHVENDLKEGMGSSVKPRALEGEGVPEDEIELGPMQVIDRKVLEAALSHDIHDWKRCADVYTDLLENYNADDWAFWLGCINATLNLAESDPNAKAALQSTVTSLQTLHANKYRGPWLASVEIAFRERTDDSLFVNEYIVPYMDRFTSKTCCVTDLQRYILALDPSGRTRLIAASQERLATALANQDANGDQKIQLQWFKQALLARKIMRYLGEHRTLSTDEMLGRVSTMLGEYKANQWINQTIGGQREVQETDDLLLLTVLYLVELYESDKVAPIDTRRTWLLQAATCLEHGLSRSAYNFQMKLLLCRVYALLGAGDAVFTRYQELDIKQIQLDSLSYLILDPLLALGQYDDAKRICESIRTLHRTTARDTPEFIARAYRLGVYSKAQDMTSFLLQKMKKSQMLSLATSELVHVQLVDLTRTTSSHLQNQFLLQPLSLLGDLEKFSASSNVLSANHHREVEVKWTALDSKNDGHYHYNSASIAPCDRTTSDANTFKQWLDLRIAVPHLTEAALKGNIPEVIKLASDLKSIVRALETTSTGSLWNVLHLAIEAVAAVAETTDDYATASSILDKLTAQLNTLDSVFKSLHDGKIIVSPATLSHASVWVYHISPYVQICLALVGKFIKPKKKSKDGASKGCYDHTKKAIAAHVELNQIGITTCKQLKAEVTLDSYEVVNESSDVVKKNVKNSHMSLAARFQAILTDQVTFLRSI